MASHGEVYVPGLGVIFLEKKGSVIDEAKKSVSAPVCLLNFIPKRSNDVRLVESFMRRKEASGKEIETFLTFEIRKLKKELASGNPVEIGTYGFLQRNHEGKIVPVSSEICYYPKEINLRNLCKSNIVAVKKEKSSNKNSNKVDSEFYHVRIHKKFANISVASICALLIALAAFLTPLNFENKDVSPKISADLFDQKVTLGNNEEIISMAGTVEPAEEIQQQRYFLIVATFHREQDAIDFVNESNINDNLELVPSKKVTRVSIESSDDISYLQSKLNSKEIRDRYPAAWIWEQTD